MQSLGLPIGFQEDFTIPGPMHGTSNHAVISVSHRVPRRYKSPSPPWNN